MVYFIFILVLVFNFVPPVFGQGKEPVLTLGTNYPSPFGVYHKLDTTYFRMKDPALSPLPCTLENEGYMYLDPADYSQYICDNSGGWKWVTYTPGLWEKLESPENSIFPKDIDTPNSPYRLGIGTDNPSPSSKLHVRGNDPLGIRHDGITNYFTAIRIEDGADSDPNHTVWELRSFRAYNELGRTRNRVFSLWGENLNNWDPANSIVKSRDVFFITQRGNFHLIDNIADLAGGGPIDPEPKLNIQAQRDAFNETKNYVDMDNLALGLTYNLNHSTYPTAKAGVAMAFGVDLDGFNPNYKQQYGAAIMHEALAGKSGSPGKLHFATKPIGHPDRDIPIQMTLDEDGHLGIGTTDPDEFKLFVEDGAFIVNGGYKVPAPTLNISGAGVRFFWWPAKKALRAGEADGDQWDDANLGKDSVAFGYGSLASGGGSAVLGGEGNKATGQYSVVSGGNYNDAVGYGSTVPGGAGNHALGQYSFVAGSGMTATANNVFLFGHGRTTASQPDTFIVMSGKVGIGTAEPAAKLHVEDGDLYVKGNIYATGAIDDYHGTYIPRGTIGPPSKRDIAETFETLEEVEAGDVLAADPKGSVKLQKSRVPYEKGVIGIVSSHPALIFDEEDIQPAESFTKGRKPPVALAGRVPCKVSNENGAIKVGDFLASSSIPGHAMKATDREQSYGAVVGKALEPFTEGPNGEATGVIKVFVTLQ